MSTVAASLDRLFDDRRLVITVGAGGVGKTTISAAIGLSGALSRDARVLVLTIDPARRLAEALGLEVGHGAQRVGPQLLADAGIELRGELWVSMLDTDAGWRDLVERLAPTPVVAEQIKGNRLFQNLTRRFAQSHSYLAMERLWQVADMFDLVVVDTPPSRNTLDILESPRKMADFFGSNLLRWLTAPYRSRLVAAASKPFNVVADRILGDRFLSDIAEFFVLFQQLGPGFVAHAAEVDELLRVDTGFVAVTTLEASRVGETAYLADQVGQSGYHLAGVVANRTLDPRLADPSVAAAGCEVEQHAERVDIDETATALAALGARAPTLVELARRENEQAAALVDGIQAGCGVVRVPLRGDGVDGLSTLVDVVTQRDLTTRATLTNRAAADEDDANSKTPNSNTGTSKTGNSTTGNSRTGRR